MKHIDPHGIGAGLGLRIYPNTPMAFQIQQEGPMAENPNIKRKYTGPIDLLHPTFYIPESLGPEPAKLIKSLIQGDARFFEPMEESPNSKDHNYNDNQDLIDAIEQGQRGAYWHMLLKARA